jgi:hypothetical protein
MNHLKTIKPGLALTFLLLVLSLPQFTLAGSPVATDFVIYQGEQDQVNPTAAFNPQGNNYLVVWSNDRPGNDDIYARQLTAHGVQLGSWFSIAIDNSGFPPHAYAGAGTAWE